MVMMRVHGNDAALAGLRLRPRLLGLWHLCPQRQSARTGMLPMPRGGLRPAAWSVGDGKKPGLAVRQAQWPGATPCHDPGRAKEKGVDTAPPMHGSTTVVGAVPEGQANHS